MISSLIRFLRIVFTQLTVAFFLRKSEKNEKDTEKTHSL